MPRPGIWLPLLLAAVCLGLGYGYWRDQQQLEAAQADNQAKGLAGQHDQREIAELRQKVRVAEATRAALQKQAEAEQKAGASFPGARAGVGPAVVRYSEIIKDHPEFAALRDKETRRNIIRQYGEAIASLNLPPAEAAQLKSLLVERQLSEQDAREAAQAAGLKPGTREFSQATSQAYQEVQQQIADLIGPDGVKALQQSQSLSGYKNMVNFNYAPGLADAGVPLSDQQALALAQALNPSAEMRGNPAARTAAYRQPDPQTWLSPADEQTLSRAAQALTPAQLEVFKSDLADQNHRNAIVQPYIQAARHGGNGGDAVFITQ